ncbi:MAG: ABC transporter ATP-binding protein [Verrucomicrobiales bacterium]
MVSIHIRDLTKRFGDTVALKGLDLDIEAGEIFFLLGASGCGKTTLLRAIAGFNTPETGRILFDKDDVTDLPPHQRGTAMMFQSYALWPHKNVFRNVAFGLEERRVPRAEIRTRVAEALAMVHMEGLGERKINQLSGGQQQRVALARSLVVRPRCLMLDEPLSNLDAKLRVEMRSEIRRICKEFGLTAIYVTHDQKEALSIADRIAVLDAGKFAQIGRPEDIYRNPHSAYVASFIGKPISSPAKSSALAAVVPLRCGPALACSMAGPAIPPGSRIREPRCCFRSVRNASPSGPILPETAMRCPADLRNRFISGNRPVRAADGGGSRHPPCL